jgi:hypothetical protein
VCQRTRPLEGVLALLPAALVMPVNRYHLKIKIKNKKICVHGSRLAPARVHACISVCVRVCLCVCVRVRACICMYASLTLCVYWENRREGRESLGQRDVREYLTEERVWAKRRERRVT